MSHLYRGWLIKEFTRWYGQDIHHRRYTNIYASNTRKIFGHSQIYNASMKPPSIINCVLQCFSPLVRFFLSNWVSICSFICRSPERPQKHSSGKETQLKWFARHFHAEYGMRTNARVLRRSGWAPARVPRHLVFRIMNINMDRSRQNDWFHCSVFFSLRLCNGTVTTHPYMVTFLSPSETHFLLFHRHPDHISAFLVQYTCKLQPYFCITKSANSFSYFSLNWFLLLKLDKKEFP